jgi:hypothetical protein
LEILFSVNNRRQALVRVLAQPAALTRRIVNHALPLTVVADAPRIKRCTEATAIRFIDNGFCVFASAFSAFRERFMVVTAFARNHTIQCVIAVSAAGTSALKPEFETITTHYSSPLAAAT